MQEIAYAIKWTWLDYWRYDCELNQVNFTMNREIWRLSNAKAL